MTKKICQKCGEEFEKKHAKKFCDECKKLICKSCGEVFLWKRNYRTNQKFCSRRCQAKWYSEQTTATKEKRKAYEKKYAQEHKNKIRVYSLGYRTRLRRRVLSVLGDKCVKCGFNDWWALQVDHINGGGNKERKNCPSPTQYLRNIIKEVKSGSKTYQLLCANCNQIKRHEKQEHRKE